MKPIAFINVLDYQAMAEGTKRNWECLHPDIPFRIVDRGRSIEIIESYGVKFSTISAMTAILLMDEGYDTIIHVDADIALFEPVTRAIETEADFAGVRANPDQGVAPNFSTYTRPNRITGEYCKAHEELNVGFYVCKNRKLLGDWIKANIKYAGAVSSGEQDVCNDILGAGRYKVEVLDPPGRNEYWGTAANWGTKFLDSWKGLRLETDHERARYHLMTDRVMLKNHVGVDKRVVMLHTAGGKWPGKELAFSSPYVRAILPPNIANYIDELRE